MLKNFNEFNKINEFNEPTRMSDWKYVDAVYFNGMRLEKKGLHHIEKTFYVSKENEKVGIEDTFTGQYDVDTGIAYFTAKIMDVEKPTKTFSGFFKVDRPMDFLELTNLFKKWITDSEYFIKYHDYRALTWEEIKKIYPKLKK